jgi:hypothetical protein
MEREYTQRLVLLLNNDYTTQYVIAIFNCYGEALLSLSGILINYWNFSNIIQF